MSPASSPRSTRRDTIRPPIFKSRALPFFIMMAIAKKLAESKYLNKKLRQNIYIHGVQCACEEGTSLDDEINGEKCFCEVDVDLLGSRKTIRTNIDQPTDVVSLKIDPVNFSDLADTNSLFKSDAD